MKTKNLSLRRLVSLLSASALLATMAVATAVGPVAATTPASNTAIFDNTPTVVPGNLPSYGPQAYSFNEWGGGVTFTGPGRQLSAATVILSSWACQTGSWDGGCNTTVGATFDVPITFNVYNVISDNIVGTLVTTKTQTFAV